LVEGQCLVSVASGNVYLLVRTLRECIYGKVKHAIRIVDVGNGVYEYGREYVAIKVMFKRKIQELRGRHNEDPIKEIAAMQFLSTAPEGVEGTKQGEGESTHQGGHPNVLPLLECVQDEDLVYCVMPYCGAELFSFVEQQGAFLEDRARQYFREILCGTNYLHSRGVCHRDLSLENVLVSQNTCIIIDMGMCLRMPVDQTTGKHLLINPQGQCGKRNYMSPEIFLNKRPFSGEAIDFWACGIILFIMLTGVPPFETATEVDPRFQMISSWRLSEMLSLWEINLSPEAVDLLSRMLRPNPQERLKYEEIMAHPWMNLS